VLAIRLQALGDTVLTLPYLRALRRALPNTTLDFLTRREVAEIPRNVVLFDHVYEIGGGRSRRQLLHALALLPRLIAHRYDVILDLQRNRLSRTVRMFANAPAWSEFDRLSARPAGERTRLTIEASGLGPLEVYPDLEPRQKDDGTDKLRNAGWDGTSALVVLNPAGSFPGRCWPLDAYVRFAELWLEHESAASQFLLLTLPGVARKSRYLKEHLGERIIDLTGAASAFEAFVLCRRAALVLSEDSGLMHIAWVAGAPTLALFGASRSDWARPLSSYSDAMRTCQQDESSCVIDGLCRMQPPAACLAALTPENVFERAREVVRRAAVRPRRIHPAD
jgi:ADP-heptose:LPS heptosyltransferase